MQFFDIKEIALNIYDGFLKYGARLWILKPSMLKDLPQNRSS